MHRTSHSAPILGPRLSLCYCFEAVEMGGIEVQVSALPINWVGKCYISCSTCDYRRPCLWGEVTIFTEPVEFFLVTQEVADVEDVWVFPCDLGHEFIYQVRGVLAREVPILLGSHV